MKAKLKSTGEIIDVECVYYAKTDRSPFIPSWDIEIIQESPWISIDKQFPEDKQPVLCFSSIYGKVVLCWDELSYTWNYPESDELYCDWDKVDCWMPIPEI